MRARVVLLASPSLSPAARAGNRRSMRTGPQARALARLFWIFTAVLGAVWVATMVALVLSRLRAAPRRGADPLAVDPAATERTHRRRGASRGRPDRRDVSWPSRRFSYGGAEGTCSATRTARHASRSPATNGGGRSATRIRTRARTFTTANEIHIPVGEPVLIKLESSDVIHSFWVPSLTGKLDLIPGRQNQIQIQADRPGIYRGQCAEFCGAAARPYGHARRRRKPRRISSAGAIARSPPPSRRAIRSASAAGDLPHASPASCATRCAAPRPAARSRPTSPMWAAAAIIAAGTLETTPRQSRRLDRRPARHQARRRTCRRSSSSPTSSAAGYLSGGPE